MKKTTLLIIALLLAATSETMLAQTPPGAGNRDARDTNIKNRSNELERFNNVRNRSNELERVKREADKPRKRSSKDSQNLNDVQPEDRLAAKYEEIKIDFEQIQQSQDWIINAYKGADKINYERIRESSLEINKSAARLNSNLFPAPVVGNSNAKTKQKNDDEQTAKEVKMPATLKEMIVELDSSIGVFIASPMFQNLRVIDPAVSEKTRLDLERIIKISNLLAHEAGKQSKTEK